MLEREKSQGSMFIFQDCQTGVGEVPNLDTNMDLMRDRRIQQFFETEPLFFFPETAGFCFETEPLYFFLRQQVCHLKLDPLCSTIRSRFKNLQGVGDSG